MMRKRPTCLLGAHFSIAKGLHHALFEAQRYGCGALQLFTKNATTWKERVLTPEETDRFEAARTQTGITAVAAHTSYLINLATGEKQKQVLSCEALKQEIVRCSALKIPFVVLHPGAHMGDGESAGIARIADNINRTFEKVPDSDTRLLLETTAGQGSGVGHTFEQLAAIRNGVDNQNAVGFCLDTSHIFAAGYDLRSRSAYRSTMNLFDAVLGLQNLCLIHLNDSKKELGSRVDRHEHIGRGHIGLKAFALIMNDPRLQNIPKIIETPKKRDGRDYDRINLNTLRKLLNN